MLEVGQHIPIDLALSDVPFVASLLEKKSWTVLKPKSAVHDPSRSGARFAILLTRHGLASWNPHERTDPS